MTTDNDHAPPTIAQMIARLGAPENYAEQALLHSLRELSARHAALEQQLASGDLSVYMHDQIGNRAQLLWWEASTTAHAIATIRTHGHTAVIPGVYGVEAVEKGAFDGE